MPDDMKELAFEQYKKQVGHKHTNTAIAEHGK